MGRPKLVRERVARPLQLPVDVSARVDAHLYSELEQKVPYGKFSEFVTEAVTEKLDQLYGAAKQHYVAEGVEGDDSAEGSVPA